MAKKQPAKPAANLGKKVAALEAHERKESKEYSKMAKEHKSIGKKK